MNNCPLCGSPLVEDIAPGAPFQLFGCGTRVWRKGSFGKPTQSPDCGKNSALQKFQAEVDTLQARKPPTPGDC